MIFKGFNDLSNIMRKKTFPLLAVVFSAFCQPVFAVPTVQNDGVRQQIEAAAKAVVSDGIAREAQRRQWSDWRADITLFFPADAAQYPRCAQPLTARLVGHLPDDFSRARVDVACGGATAWQIQVTAKPAVFLSIATARYPLARGHVIQPGDVVMKKQNIAMLRGGFVTRPASLTGLTVKRRVREQQPLVESMVESPVLVARGQQVVMVADNHGVVAHTTGEAMQNGRKGTVIKVKNLTSQRVVSATVTGKGQVRMLSPQTP